MAKGKRQLLLFYTKRKSKKVKQKRVKKATEEKNNVRKL